MGDSHYTPKQALGEVSIVPAASFLEQGRAQGWNQDFPSFSSSPAVLLTQKCKGQEARKDRSQIPVWKDESFNTMPQLWSQQQNLQLDSFLKGVGMAKNTDKKTNSPRFLPVTPWSIRRSRAQSTGRICMPGSHQQSLGRRERRQR